MASAALSAAIWAATEPLVTAPLLYILTRGPPHLREHLLAPFDNNALATNGVARVAALVTALKVLTSLGVVKRIDAALTRLALNNWRFGRAGKGWKFGPQKEEVIVITGASSGIGAEMVKGFAPMARVIAIDVQDFPEELGNLPDVTFYHCDITDLDAVHETCKQIRTRHGDPSVLINNAGVAAPGPSILESTNAGTERVIKVNLLSHFTLIREFLPGMLHQRKGHIVTMASLASFVAATGSLEYSISKVGALYLSDGIRAECLARYPGGEAICTTSVHPVWHKTNIVGEAEWKKLAQEGVRVDPPSNVSRVVVKQVLMGKSARLFVPEKMRWIAGIRSWPIWVQDLIMGDWKGKRRAGFKRNPES